MTGLSVLLGWAMAGRVLRPLQRITATAKRVSQDNLDERIALEGPRDELKELADTFDGMLERLSGAFASQRRFVANASHELRTPLTVIRTELDVTLADPHATTADLRAMGETVRDATLATERLIQALLTLARSEGGVTRRDPVDLADCARTAVAPDRRRGARPRPRRPPGARPRARARRPAAARAARREPRRERRPPQRRRRDGRGADGERRGAQHGRGAQRRAGRAARGGRRRCSSPSSASTAARRGDGVGLGLSIVRSVAEAHGGSVELRARPSGGLVVRVSLPARDGASTDADFISGDYADDRARAHA